MFRHRGAAHEVLRNGTESDGSGNGLTRLPYGPLEANWRRRIRGAGRRPNLLGRGYGPGPWGAWSAEQPAGHRGDGDAPDAAAHLAGHLGDGEGPEGAESEAVVLEFPSGIRTATAKPPAGRPRGPLAWAYWSERRT